MAAECVGAATYVGKMRRGLYEAVLAAGSFVLPQRSSGSFRHGPERPGESAQHHDDGHRSQCR
jgi:hypothetical protein